MLTTDDRKRGAILGAAVADAASLGFHWLYDQDRISALAPSAPEFRAPTPSDYEGTMGFFAHANKSVGMCSQYGEQHLTMLQALLNNNGNYEKAQYEEAFISCFGYGGSYSGYIDRPTRDTLNNITAAEQQAQERALSIAFNGPKETIHQLLTKVVSNAKQYKGDELNKQLEAAVRLTHDDDAMVVHAFKMLEQWQSVGDLHGANDTQLPAISKLVPLVALYAQQENLSTVVESAVRVTNNNDKAVAFGQACANMIEAAITTGDAELAVDAAKQELTGSVKPLVEQALAAIDKSTPDVTAEWGMACQLDIGFPSAVHNIATATSFEQAVRQNIYAGGDSCGRSILIGAVLGACYGIDTEQGIPAQWIKTLHQSESIEKSIASLLGR